MKSTFKMSRINSVAGNACSALFLALIPAAALADRGQGSIRASARPAAPPQRDVRAQAPRAALEARPDVHPDAHPVPPPHIDVQVRRDWDDNDDDPKSWGEFAHGVPGRVIRGQRVHELPLSHRVIVINNQNYDYDDGGYYYLQQSDGDYVVVQPPVGAVVPALPDGVAPIVVGTTTYDYIDGVFYVAQDDSFAVVNPPPGIVVPTLPTGAAQAVINGNVLFQFNGFNYQPSIQDGVTVYAVTPS